MSPDDFTADDLQNNWEHALVGREFTYTLQAGSNLVRIGKRSASASEGILVPVEELRGMLAEYDEIDVRENNHASR